MSNMQLFMYVAMGIAFIEELFKWLAVYKISYNNSEFNNVYDAIVYCVFVSLVFACLENLFYVFSATTIWVGILRAITAIPGHACDAVIMGDYLGLAKLNQIKGNRNKEKKYKFLSIFMPSLIHTIYDYCIYTQSIGYIILFVFFLIFIYIFSINKIKKLSSLSNDFNN